MYSQGVTERHVHNLDNDNMVAHGINCIGVYVQGSNAGWPDPNANKNGYTPEGHLRPELPNGWTGSSARLTRGYEYPKHVKD